MHNPCHELAVSYVLYQNPLYTYSFPIALLCAILAYGLVIAMKWSNNSYVTQIIVPIITLVVVMSLLEMIARANVRPSQVEMYTHLCNKLFRA